MSEYFDNYVSMEIFLSYGIYTGADLDYFRLYEEELDQYKTLDLYTVTGKIAAVPPRTGSNDIPISVLLVMNHPSLEHFLGKLAEDLELFYNEKILRLLDSKRWQTTGEPVSFPLEIEIKDAGNHTVLLMNIETDEENFTDTAQKISMLYEKANKHHINEISLFRDENGGWRISGQTEETECDEPLD